MADLVFVGHPFSTLGVSEQLRSHYRATKSFSLDADVLDVYRHADRGDVDYYNLISGSEVERLTSKFCVYHINGDEVVDVLSTLKNRGINTENCYNVICPAWELPIYPKIWIDQLKRFDEIWALSRFIQSSLSAVGLESAYIGQSVEMPVAPYLPRRYFDLRESALTFLHFFDLTSYTSRKNPDGVLEFFRKLRKKRPFADVQLVLKVKSGDTTVEDYGSLASTPSAGIKFLSAPLTAYETRSLINCCDCFVSLHRAEGFGRGVGEAMALGRVALATSWSGNMDLMDANNSLPVAYKLRPLVSGEYPAWEGQEWAEPDIDHAVALAVSIIDDPSKAHEIGAKAKQTVRKTMSDRAVGIRIGERLRSFESSR